MKIDKNQDNKPENVTGVHDDLKNESEKEKGTHEEAKFSDLILDIPIVKRALEKLKNNPKRTFLGMIVLVALSLTYNTYNYITYEDNNIEISNVLKENRANHSKEQIRKNNINKQLDYLRAKEVLTKTDTLKIKFLLKSLEDER